MSMDEAHASSGWEALGALVRDARKRLGLSQAAVVDLLNRDLEERGHGRVHQSVVSGNEAGDRWRDRPELVGAYTRVLRLTGEEVTATLYGVSGPRQQASPPTLEDVVRSDPSLDDASKEHIIKQYALLRAATMHNRLSRTRNSIVHGEPSPDRSEVSDEELEAIDEHFSNRSGGASPPPDNTETA